MHKVKAPFARMGRYTFVCMRHRAKSGQKPLFGAFFMIEEYGHIRSPNNRVVRGLRYLRRNPATISTCGDQMNWSTTVSAIIA